jgi:hypothetical protein
MERKKIRVFPESANFRRKPYPFIKYIFKEYLGALHLSGKKMETNIYKCL